MAKRKKMNADEQWFLNQIELGLGEGGNRPFYEYLHNNHFNLKFTEDIDAVAYVQSGINTIYINEYFYYKYLEDDDIDSVLMLVKHEILHKALAHEEMTMRIIANKLHIDFDDMDDLTLEQIRSLAYSPSAFQGSLQNIAGDYHIGRYYTALDKKYVRELEFQGQKIAGLLNVYNDPKSPYPDMDFDNMTFEELYTFFSQENLKRMMNSDEFEFEYGYFDDDDDEAWEPLKLDYRIYLLVDDNGVIFGTLDQKEVVSQFAKRFKVFSADVTKEEYKKGEKDEFDGMPLKEFMKEYPYCKVQEVEDVSKL